MSCDTNKIWYIITIEFSMSVHLSDPAFHDTHTGRKEWKLNKTFTSACKENIRDKWYKPGPTNKEDMQKINQKPSWCLAKPAAGYESRCPDACIYVMLHAGLVTHLQLAAPYPHRGVSLLRSPLITLTQGPALSPHRNLIILSG